MTSTPLNSIAPASPPPYLNRLLKTWILQHGGFPAHLTIEATFHFLSPVGVFQFSSHCKKLTLLALQIFNHLVPQFDSIFRNLPESIIESRITNKKRIEYYLRAFGSISVLVVEVRLQVLNDQARLDAIAQVIAECNGQLCFFPFVASGCLFIYDL